MTSQLSVRSWTVIFVVALFCERCQLAAQQQVTVSYQNQVAPLLAKYCAGCHGATEPESGFSVQSAEELLKERDGGLVLDRGQPSKSLLLRVLNSSDEDHMPPRDEPQPTDDELRLISDWIQAGSVFDGSSVSMLSVPDIRSRRPDRPSAVFSLAVSADSSVRYEGLFRAVRVVGSSGSSEPSLLAVEGGKITDICIEPDSSSLLLATGVAGFSGQAVRVDPADGRVLGRFTGHSDIVYAVAATADSRLVATAGYDRQIRVYDGVTAGSIMTLTGHNGAVFDLDFSPDGAVLASASADGTIKVWSTKTGERLDTMSQPQAEQYVCVFSPDGKFIFAAGADNRIRKWKVESRATAMINPLMEARFAHEGVIHAMVISSDGQYLATAADDGSLKVWQADTLTQLASHVVSPDLAIALAFDPASGDLLAGTLRGEVRRFPAVTAPDGDSHLSFGKSSMAATATAVDAVPATIGEQEPNDHPVEAMTVQLPVTIAGKIYKSDRALPDNASDGDASTGITIDQSGGSRSSVDADLHRFTAVAGQSLMIEVKASRAKSQLDSKVEVLTADGQPILQTRLQAIRDSYFTFRGKDSDTSDDFRLFNWAEMDLNQYLYADGEVVRLWLYPRGPDSGYKVYPGFGKRHTYFGTTPTSHALQAPAFIVVPRRPDEQFADNGLPVFPLYYENDDDPLREWGADSRLMFTAPSDGDYLVKITDARDFSGEDFDYELTLRAPQPDFRVTVGGNKVNVHGRTGRELSFTATRMDGFDGPIELLVENLPDGVSTSLPTEIEQDQLQAFATIIAQDSASQPSEDDIAKIRFVARGTINGQPVSHDIGGLTELKLAQAPRITVTIHSLDATGKPSVEHSSELTAVSGQTTRALLRVTRNNFEGNVEFGKEDAGRNLPHGVIVDNIGLNGLMLLPGQTEREVFLKVASWVPEMSRPFYLKSNVDGITSLPVMIHVRHEPSK